MCRDDTRRVRMYVQSAHAHDTQAGDLRAGGDDLLPHFAAAADARHAVARADFDERVNAVLHTAG